MKRKLYFGAAFLLLTWAITSCDKLSDCKMCKYVTYENGVATVTGTETEYCGTDLITKQAAPDAVIGTLTTKFECR